LKNASNFVAKVTMSFPGPLRRFYKTALLMVLIITGKVKIISEVCVPYLCMPKVYFHDNNCRGVYSSIIPPPGVGEKNQRVLGNHIGCPSNKFMPQ
jgi:hypothetical protein